MKFMWPINYEDIDKLHMSIGAGLMVASFILLLSSTWTTLSHYEDYLDGISPLIEKGIETQNGTIEGDYIKLMVDLELRKRDIVFGFNENNYKTSNRLLYIGIAFFLWGYFPFWKKNRIRRTLEKDSP